MEKYAVDMGGKPTMSQEKRIRELYRKNGMNVSEISITPKTFAKYQETIEYLEDKLESKEG